MSAVLAAATGLFMGRASQLFETGQTILSSRGGRTPQIPLFHEAVSLRLYEPTSMSVLTWTPTLFASASRS